MTEPFDPATFRRLVEFAASQAMTRAQDFQFPREMPQVFEHPAHAVEGAFIGIVPFLKKSFIVLVMATMMLLSSLATYGLFYLTVMPGLRVVEPLYFDYSGTSRHPAPICTQEDVNNCPQLVPEGPWAVADLFSKHTQWDPFRSDVTPKPLTDKRILNEGKAYNLEVHLDLPESEINRMSGMFGVLVELQSSQGEKLAVSTRAARLPHESLWLSTIRKCIWLVPLMIGAAEESRRVIVPSFRHFVESSDMPLQYVSVRLLMKDRDLYTRVENLEVTKAEVRIRKELSRFQFMLKEWFFTCYLVGTSFVFVYQLAALLIIRLYWQYRTSQRIQDDPSLNLNLDESQLESDLDPVDVSSDGRDEWEDLPQRSTEPNRSEETSASVQADPPQNTETSNESVRNDNEAVQPVVDESVEGQHVVSDANESFESSSNLNES